MSSYRAGQPKSETRKPARDGLSLSTKLSLLAAGSLLPILMAPAANAQCTAVDANNQPVSLTALTSNSIATCTGSTTGANISVSPPVSNVLMQFLGGATVTNSNFTLYGSNHAIGAGIGSTFNNVGFAVDGANGQIYLQGNGQGVAALATGSNAFIAIAGGGTWNTNIVRASGTNALIEIGNNTTVQGAGAAIGLGVLSGGADSNVYSMQGNLIARTDGLLITDDGGDDIYYINPGATFNAAGGAQGRISDVGGDNDLLVVSGSHILNLDITGIESMIYSGSSLDNFTFNGNGNLRLLSVNNGSIGQIDIGFMMDANGVINIGADGRVRYGGNAFVPAFTQSLMGTGEFWLDSATTNITGNNSDFSGTFRVSGDAVVGSNQNAFGTANVVTQNGNLILSNVDIANQISGNGQVTMTGSGAPSSRSSLSGVNSYSGGTLITNAGSTLALLNASAAGTGAVTANSGTFLELDFGAGGGDFTNLITGNGSLRKTGAGTLTVSNTANDYTGGTQIDGGALRITDFDALGVGPIVANAGGALMYDYSGAASELFTAPFLTGDGQFIKAGSGTIVFSNANTWTGGSQILAGRVGLNNGQGLGTGNIDIAQGAILGIGGVTLANNVSGAGQIIKTANNTAVLTGINTMTGGIVIEDGAIEVASGASLGNGTVDVQAGGSLLVSNTADTTVSAQLQGIGAVVKAGAGRAELTGNNGLGGLVSVQAGTLAVASTGNIGSAVVDVSAGATLELARSVGNGSFDNDITGAGRVIKTGTSRITVNGNNTYSGGTHIMGGSLRVTDLSHLGSGAILVDQGAALDLSIASNATFNQALSGAGMLRKSGIGSLTLISNALSGGLDIEQGNVTVNTLAALGAGPVSTAQGSTLTISNAATEVSSVAISGSGALIKEGQGDLIIQNANTYSGGTTINAGRIGLNNGQGLGSGDVLVNANAVLSLGGVSVANNISGAGSVLKTANNIGGLTGVNTYSGGTTVQDGALRVASGLSLGTGAVSLATGTTLDMANTANTTLANLIQGAGGLHKGGNGGLTIGTANTYTGGTVIDGGAIIVNHGQALGTGNVAISSGALLGLGDVAFGNLISGAGAVVKTGTGVGQLTGVNTYSGGTAVSSGTLRVTNTSAIGTGGVNIASGAFFEMANATNLTFANALSGPGTFRKMGAGDLTFSNAFSVGTLLIDAGRVRLNAAMTGNATVGAGGILNGVGQVNGTLTNNGIVAPGNSIGTLNVQGNYVHNANSILEIEFDANGGIDLLNVSGTAQLNGGTLRFVSLGGAEGTGGTFLVANGGVSGTFATIETVGAQLPLAVIYQPNASIMAPSVLTARPSTFNSQALAASDTMMGFANMAARQALRPAKGNGAWAEVFSANGSRDAVGQTLAYDHDSTGISVGVRGPLTDRIDAGVSLGWSQGDISLGSNGGGGQQDGMLASAFASYRLDGASIGGGILYGSIDQSTVRNVSFNSFSASVAGDTDSVVTGAFLSGDTIFGQAGNWTFGGAAQASYLSQVQDGYTENGSSPLRLQLPELTFETLGVEAAVTAGTSFTLGATNAHVQFEAGVRHTEALDDRVLPVRFAASNATVDLQGDAREHTSPFAGASFEWALGGMTTLTAGYEGRFGDDERHEARLGLQVGF